MFSLLTLSLIGSPVCGEPFSWPQFLGPQRNGVSQETQLANGFPEAGPTVLWRVKGGIGMTGLAIANGQAYLGLQETGRQKLVALDVKTGDRTWEAELASAYENAMGDGPRATPTVDGNQIFAVTGEGIVVAMNASSGEVLWRQNLPEKFNCKPAEYGVSGSPLVFGDLVVAPVGGTDAAVAALDRYTGNVVWQAGSGPTGYASPVQMELAGVQQVVGFVASGAMGIEPKTGKVLWEYAYPTDYHCNTANPVLVAGKLFISAGENHGCVLLNVEKGATGFDIGEVWASQGGGSSFRCEWQTPVLIDGYLYGFDNVGSAGAVTHLTCVHAATGEVAWRQARFGKGNLIAVGKTLLMSTMEGELILARADPKSYVELARAKVIGKTRQAPALANGFVYLRDDAEVVCIDLRAR